MDKLKPELVFHTDDEQIATAVIKAIKIEYPTMEVALRQIPNTQPKFSVGIMVREGHDDVARNMMYFCHGVNRGWHVTLEAMVDAAKKISAMPKERCTCGTGTGERCPMHYLKKKPPTRARL